MSPGDLLSKVLLRFDYAFVECRADCAIFLQGLEPPKLILPTQQHPPEVLGSLLRSQGIECCLTVSVPGELKVLESEAPQMLCCSSGDGDPGCTVLAEPWTLRLMQISCDSTLGFTLWCGNQKSLQTWGLDLACLRVPRNCMWT